MTTPQPPRLAETAIAPITDITLDDITEAANTVDLWLRQLSDNHLTLATLKQAADYVPIANNIMAAVDAVGDIIALAESEQSDPLAWVSLGINLIGIIPIPPTLAFARKSLRPTLHLVRQQLKANPKAALGDALVTVLSGHLNATILGELENFVTQAQARLPALLEDCAQTGTAIILALAGGIEDFLSGQLKPSPVVKGEHASLLDTLARNATLPLEVATVASLNGLSRLLPASTRTLGLNYAQRLRHLATEVAPNLRALANADTPHSIAYLLAMLAQAAKRKRIQLSINIPAAGTRQVRHISRQQQLGAIGRQRPARQDPGAAKNGACSGTCNSISFARGSEQLVHTDFTLPGPFAVTWSRNYRSSQAALDDGPLGARWISPFTVFFQVIEHALRYQAADGRSHDYPLPRVGKFHHDPVEDIVLVRTGERTLSLARGYRVEERYEQVGDRWRLSAIHQRGGAWIALHYEHAHQDVHILSDLLTYQDERLHQHIHTRLDASGRIESLWSMRDGKPTRQLAAYQYSEDGDLASAQDEHGRQWTYAYRHHLLTRHTDRTGRAMNLRWQGSAPDAKAIAEWADDGSHAVHLAWDAHLRLTRVTDALGHETRHYYNLDGYTYRIVHPDGLEEWFFRDAAMNVVQHVHRDGGIDHYTYDPRGNLLQHTRADHTSVHHAYDELNQRFKTRDAEGGLWKYEHDQRGNLIQTQDPLENTTEYLYDRDNQLTTIIDANGAEKKLAYDRDGHLSHYTDCSGKTTQWHYNALGQLRKLTNAAGEVTLYQYAAGYLSQVIYPDSTREQFEYDAEGRLLSFTDALYRKTVWTYDEAGLIRQRLDANDTRLTYHWDALGQLVRLDNENDSQATFSYDPLGRLLAETGFNRQSTHYRYARGSDLPTWRADGERITHFEYDAMGRLVRRQAERADGTDPDIETFAYDGNGRLLLARNQACKLQWVYDLAGNNTREHQHLGYLTYPYVAVFTHEYDALNQRIASTRPDGHRVSWLTYGSGHLLGLKFDEHELLSYGRDDLHREITREQGNGLIQRQQWTPNGQLLEQKLGPRDTSHFTALRRYRYDAGGQLTDVDDLQRGAIHYHYDPLGRLLEATGQRSHERFAFDPASNLLDPDAPPGPNPYAPIKLSDNVLRSYSGNQYRYDARGNLIERIEAGQHGHFVWDLYNRLRRYEDDRLIVEFSYDALGRRLHKKSTCKYREDPQASARWNEYIRRKRAETPASGLTGYLWDGDTIATECRVDEQQQGITLHYVFEPGTFVPVAQAVINTPLNLIPQPVYGEYYSTARDPVWQHKPTPGKVDAFAWYQCDQLGTPMELTDSDGQVAWRGHYKAWGLATEERSETAKRKNIHNALRFQGQYFDVETGLHYNRYRYYDPRVGRFIGKDPIGFAGGVNVYQYSSNPINWTDPLGLEPELGDLGSETHPFDTSRGARREAMRQAKIPTNQQPISQSKNQSGFEYRYEMPHPGGGKGQASVQQQTLDSSHIDKPHWEAGVVKLDDNGNPRLSQYDRPKIRNGKGKAFYKKECCS